MVYSLPQTVTDGSRLVGVLVAWVSLFLAGIPPRFAGTGTTSVRLVKVFGVHDHEKENLCLFASPALNCSSKR